MNLLKSFSRLAAVTATVGLLIAPIASADHHRRGGDSYQRSHNGNHHARGHHRGDAYRGHRGQTRHYRDQRRYVNRPRAHRYDRRTHRQYRHAPRYSNRYARPYRQTYNRAYAHSPRYSRRAYAPRYNVGHRYTYYPRTVVIRDYGRYGLYNPPRGYHWVHDHDRGDAILASVATGAIIGLVVGAIAYD